MKESFMAGKWRYRSWDIFSFQDFDFNFGKMLKRFMKVVRVSSRGSWLETMDAHWVVASIFSRSKHHRKQGAAGYGPWLLGFSYRKKREEKHAWASQAWPKLWHVGQDALDPFLLLLLLLLLHDVFSFWLFFIASFFF